MLHCTIDFQLRCIINSYEPIKKELAIMLMRIIDWWNFPERIPAAVMQLREIGNVAWAPRNIR